MPLRFTNYLFKCDYLYKHNVNSIYDIVQVEKLSISASTAEINSELKQFVSHSSAEIELNLVLLFYINYLTQTPKITFLKNSAGNDIFMCRLILHKRKGNLFLFKFFTSAYIKLLNYQLHVKNKNVLAYNKLNLITSSSLYLFFRDILGVIGLKHLTIFTNIKFM